MSSHYAKKIILIHIGSVLFVAILTGIFAIRTVALIKDIMDEKHNTNACTLEIVSGSGTACNRESP